MALCCSVVNQFLVVGFSDATLIMGKESRKEKEKKSFLPRTPFTQTCCRKNTLRLKHLDKVSPACSHISLCLLSKAEKGFVVL